VKDATIPNLAPWLSVRAIETDERTITRIKKNILVWFNLLFILFDLILVLFDF